MNATTTTHTPTPHQHPPPPPTTTENEDCRFNCNICLDSVSEPVVTRCGHLYCWPCLYQWLEPGMHEHEYASLVSNNHNSDADDPSSTAQYRLESRSALYDGSRRVCPVCKSDCSVSTLVPIYVRALVEETKPVVVMDTNADAADTVDAVDTTAVSMAAATEEEEEVAEVRTNPTTLVPNEDGGDIDGDGWTSVNDDHNTEVPLSPTSHSPAPTTTTTPTSTTTTSHPPPASNHHPSDTVSTPYTPPSTGLRRRTTITTNTTTHEAVLHTPTNVPTRPLPPPATPTPTPPYTHSPTLAVIHRTGSFLNREIAMARDRILLQQQQQQQQPGSGGPSRRRTDPSEGTTTTTTTNGTPSLHQSQSLFQALLGMQVHATHPQHVVSSPTLLGGGGNGSGGGGGGSTSSNGTFVPSIHRSEDRSSLTVLGRGRNPYRSFGDGVGGGGGEEEDEGGGEEGEERNGGSSSAEREIRNENGRWGGGEDDAMAFLSRLLLMLGCFVVLCLLMF